MVPLRREGQGERPCPGHGSADQVQGGTRTHRGNQGSEGRRCERRELRELSQREQRCPRAWWLSAEAALTSEEAFTT